MISEVRRVFEGAEMVGVICTEDVARVDSDDDETFGMRIGDTVTEGMKVAIGLDEEMPASFDEAATALVVAGGVLSVSLWRTMGAVLAEKGEAEDVVAMIGVVEEVGAGIELDAATMLVALPLPPPP